MFSLNQRQKKRELIVSYFGWYIVNLCRDIFIVSLISFLVFFLLEQLKTGIISNYFDLNILMIIAIISGIIVIFFEHPEAKKITSRAKIVYLVLISLTTGIFSYQYLQNFRILSYLIPLLTILIVYLATSLFFNNEEEL